MKMLDAIKYFLFYSVNWFWVATFWAVKVNPFSLTKADCWLKLEVLR